MPSWRLLWRDTPVVYNRPDQSARTTVAWSTGTWCRGLRCRDEAPGLAGPFSFHKFKQDRHSLSYYSFHELLIQGRQCTYNVTLTCVRESIVSVETSTFSACICRIRYVTCKTHVPYCHYGLLDSTVFFIIIS